MNEAGQAAKSQSITTKYIIPLRSTIRIQDFDKNISSNMFDKMDREKAAKSLKAVVAKVLEIPEAKLDASCKRNTSDAWDSFNHLLLMSEVEKALSVTYTMEEIDRVQGYGDLEKLTIKKLGL